MDLKSIKPLHGWRAFAGEVGTIVLGVLLALAADQYVDHIDRQGEARDTMEAVRAELAHSAGAFDERVAVQQCLDRRLKQLDAIFRQARRTGRLPDIGEIGRPPARPIQSSVWSSAVNTDIVADFDTRQRDALSIIYAQSATYYDDVIAEQDMWSTLTLLEHAPGPIDGAMLAEIGGTLARLQFRSLLNGVDSQQLLDRIRAEGITPDYLLTNLERDRHNRAAMLDQSRQRPVCAPLRVDGRTL
jgi:hypothetical protein